MQQLRLKAPRELVWIEVAEPVLSEPLGALVRPVAVAVCDLDKAVIGGAYPIPLPLDLGHEFVGEVLGVGQDVGSFAVGDIVVASFQISCGVCDRCSRGLTGNCTAVDPGSMYGLGDIGGRKWGGALSDVVSVPFAETMLFKMPQGLAPATVASASDNIVDAYRTVASPLIAQPGANVLIVAGGAPSIALYAVDIAVALGASKVDYIDTDAHRLELAAKLGANPMAGPPPRKAGRYAITVDASADPDGLNCAILSTEPGGTCTSIGIYLMDTAMPLFEMYSKGINFITGRPNSVASLPAVLDLAASGAIHPDVLATTVSWDQAPEAMLDDYVKLIITR